MAKARQKILAQNKQGNYQVTKNSNCKQGDRDVVVVLVRTKLEPQATQVTTLNYNNISDQHDPSANQTQCYELLLLSEYPVLYTKELYRLDREDGVQTRMADNDRDL